MFSSCIHNNQNTGTQSATDSTLNNRHLNAPEKELNYDSVQKHWDSIHKAYRAGSVNDSLHEITLQLKNYLIPSLPDSNYITIDSDAAIFIIPDSAQYAQLIKEDENATTSAASDFEYSQSEAYKYFQKKGIKSLYPEKRYLKFIYNRKPLYLDTKPKNSLIWFTIIYRQDSMPQLIEAWKVDGMKEYEYTHYFGRK